MKKLKGIITKRININDTIIFDDKYSVIFKDEVSKEGINTSGFDIKEDDKYLFSVIAPQLAIQNIDVHAYGVSYTKVLTDKMFKSAYVEFLNH